MTWPGCNWELSPWCYATKSQCPIKSRPFSSPAGFWSYALEDLSLINSAQWAIPTLTAASRIKRDAACTAWGKPKRRRGSSHHSICLVSSVKGQVINGTCFANLYQSPNNPNSREGALWREDAENASVILSIYQHWFSPPACKKDLWTHREAVNRLPHSHFVDIFIAC